MANRFLSDPDPTTAWAKAAVDGKLFTCGELVRHAAERHLRDLRDGDRTAKLAAVAEVAQVFTTEAIAPIVACAATQQVAMQSVDPEGDRRLH
ncbi:hypothetical protein [Sphingomonas sp. PB4P5]|uniref:hypothetical protein n=1 Tax=Parasphingomonas puruogangriensis TaxID=3096155 RepID=UPI002FCAE468